MAEDLKNISLKEPVDKWATIAIKRFQEELRKRRIGVTNELFHSFAKELKLNGGDVEAVIIRFNFYGRFRDMGVGRGVSAHEVKSNKANLIAAKRYNADVGFSRRQPKRWYAKRKTSETLRLKEILIEQLGHDIIQSLEGSFAANIKITI